MKCDSRRTVHLCTSAARRRAGARGRDARGGLAARERERVK